MFHYIHLIIKMNLLLIIKIKIMKLNLANILKLIATVAVAVAGVITGQNI